MLPLFPLKTLSLLCTPKASDVADSLAIANSEYIAFAYSHLSYLCFFPHFPIVEFLSDSVFLLVNLGY